MIIKTEKNHYYFAHSPDEDFPSGEIVAVFNEEDNCTEDGLTHGLLSHAVKHLQEFDSSFVSDVLNCCIAIMKTAPNIWLKNKNGQVIQNGIRA